MMSQSKQEWLITTESQHRAVDDSIRPQSISQSKVTTALALFEPEKIWIRQPTQSSQVMTALNKICS